MSDKPVTELIDRLSRIALNAGHAKGMKPAQWEALRYLSLANRFSATPGALTLWLGSTKGTVSQTVISLEKRGLVVKTAASDKRSVRLKLTDAGIDMLRDDGLSKIDNTIATLDPEIKSAVASALTRLVSALLESNGSRPFGICQTCKHFARQHAEGAPHYCRLLKEKLLGEDAQKICVEQEAA
jgi:DNA-binding MarR family transcriptional regulator